MRQSNLPAHLMEMALITTIWYARECRQFCTWSKSTGPCYKAKESLFAGRWQGSAPANKRSLWLLCLQSFTLWLPAAHYKASLEQWQTQRPCRSGLGLGPTQPARRGNGIQQEWGRRWPHFAARLLQHLREHHGRCTELLTAQQVRNKSLSAILRPGQHWGDSDTALWRVTRTRLLCVLMECRRVVS